LYRTFYQAERPSLVPVSSCACLIAIQGTHMATAASQRRLPSFSHNKSFMYSLYPGTWLRHSQFGAKADTGCSGIAVATTAAAPAPTDEHFMRLALQQAKTAYEQGEVPIGAVLVINSEVIAAAYNMTETKQNPLCHAELLCISAAAQEQLAWRLHEATLYSTIEPCPMCAGAALQARLARLVYGARQPRVGADGSWVAMFPQQQQQAQQQQQTQQPIQQQVPQEACHEQQLRHNATAEQVQPIQKASVYDGSLGQEPVSRHQHVQQQQQATKQDVQQQQLQQQQVPEQQEAGDTVEQQYIQQQHQPLQPVGPHPFHPDIRVTRGVLASECATLMKTFFRKRREQQAAAAMAVLVDDTSQEQCTHQHRSQHQQLQQQLATAAQAGVPAAAAASEALDGSCVASGAAAGGCSVTSGVRADADAALWLSSSSSEDDP
jgi:tRNA(adenine34) deaminase